MSHKNDAVPRILSRRWLNCLMLCLAGFLCNLILNYIVDALNLPLYLDTVGTILAAAAGGYVPGILTGFITSFLKTMYDPLSAYYTALAMLIAVVTAFAAERKYFRSVPKTLGVILVLTLIGGGLGSVLTWFLYDMNIGSEAGETLAWALYHRGISNPFLAQLTADLIVDFADKAFSVLLMILTLRLIPPKILERFRFTIRSRAAMSRDTVNALATIRPRKWSLRAKITLLVTLSMIVIAVITTGISYYMFQDSLIATHVETGKGITNMIAALIDPDQVNTWISEGESAPGYAQTKAAMADVLSSSADIQYIYVYQIQEDGCHVVFDLDTPDTPGAAPGEIIPFDESFLPLVPALLSGEEIDPIITNETYGWLLSVYRPIRDTSGVTVCYAAADISMSQLSRNGHAFLIRALSLFISFTVLILAGLLLLAEHSIIFPIDAMAAVSGTFAYTSEAQRARGVRHIHQLDIRTGDEIENLYLALTKTMEDSVRYIADSQQKNETIARMQENLIATLAGMVESRDLYTGNHIKNTAEYVRIILDQMKEDGIYTDQLTDEFITNTIRSAPMHDVGKIRISDTLLNKPGKLTPEEFEEMKKHTLYGREIIQSARGASSDEAYLDEAENLAAYHHERWDGTGYPCGLKGEEIPLSARVMAVADVFDALVSKRSYKEGFSVDQSLRIIQEETGTHFDPQVAEAFLRAEDKVRRVAEARG